MRSSPENPVVKYTAEEVLELVLDANLSKKQCLDAKHGAVVLITKTFVNIF